MHQVGQVTYKTCTYSSRYVQQLEQYIPTVNTTHYIGFLHTAVFNFKCFRLQLTCTGFRLDNNSSLLTVLMQSVLLCACIPEQKQLTFQTNKMGQTEIGYFLLNQTSKTEEDRIIKIT